MKVVLGGFVIFPPSVPSSVGCGSGGRGGRGKGRGVVAVAVADGKLLRRVRRQGVGVGLDQGGRWRRRSPLFIRLPRVLRMDQVVLGSTRGRVLSVEQLFILSYWCEIMFVWTVWLMYNAICSWPTNV